MKRTNKVTDVIIDEKKETEKENGTEKR